MKLPLSLSLPAPKLTVLAPEDETGHAGVRYRLGDLLQGHNAIVIEHQGQLYRLSLTRQGKLILTK